MSVNVDDDAFLVSLDRRELDAVRRVVALNPSRVHAVKRNTIPTLQSLLSCLASGETNNVPRSSGDYQQGSSRRARAPDRHSADANRLVRELRGAGQPTQRSNKTWRERLASCVVVGMVIICAPVVFIFCLRTLIFLFM